MAADAFRACWDGRPRRADTTAVLPLRPCLAHAVTCWVRLAAAGSQTEPGGVPGAAGWTPRPPRVTLLPAAPCLAAVPGLSPLRELGVHLQRAAPQMMVRGHFKIQGDTQDSAPTPVPGPAGGNPLKLRLCPPQGGGPPSLPLDAEAVDAPRAASGTLPDQPGPTPVWSVPCYAASQTHGDVNGDSTS